MVTILFTRGCWIIDLNLRSNPNVQTPFLDTNLPPTLNVFLKSRSYLADHLFERYKPIEEHEQHIETDESYYDIHVPEAYFILYFLVTDEGSEQHDVMGDKQYKHLVDHLEFVENYIGIWKVLGMIHRECKVNIVKEQNLHCRVVR